jgi:lipoprotein-releasing system permease protein
VVAASPFVYINVTLQTKGMSYSFPLRGVVPELEARTSTIRKKMISGDFAFPVETVGSEDPIIDEEPVKIVSVLIGKIIADETGLSPGDSIRIASSTIGVMGREQRVLTARINGVFSYGTYDQDSYVYSSLETAQILQNIGTDVSGLSVLTEDLSEALEVKRMLMRKLGEDYRVITWIEKNPELFDLLNQERSIMFFIVALIIAVAALNIISSLSMMVNHKRKEIGILRSLGAKRRSITAIFGLMGVFIGTIGTGLGIIGGILISLNFNSIRQWVSNTFGFNLFSIFREIPVVVRMADILIIGGVAISLCILVSIYPAWKASRLHPVEALRYE